MPNTGQILTTMRDELADWMVRLGYGSNVYIAEAPIDEVTTQYAIQLVPGPDTAAHPNSGVGLVRSSIDIVVWWRGMQDPVMRGTYRIAGEDGIQPFVDVLREWLVQRDFDLMTVALTFRNGGKVQAVAELEGWLTLTDTYEYAYEMDWTVK
jgi:hypothetical protein